MKTALTATAIAAALTITTPASAATLIQGIAQSFSTNGGTGLLISAQPTAEPFSVLLSTLNQPSAAVKVFTVGTSESSVDLDDFLPRSISANFLFTSPDDATDPNITGTTTGFYTLSLGGACGAFAGGCGRVQWNGPQTFNFGNGGSFSLNLSNAQFTTPGQADVFGTFTLLSASVPEPSTWAMMILGIGLAGAAMRRRKVRVAYA